MKIKDETSLKRLKTIIRWLVGIIAGVLLLVYLLLSLPPFQRWMAGKAADVLSGILNTRVEIDRIEVGLMGRAIVDGIRVWDQQGRPLLQATRTAAQISLSDLITDRHIVINSAQLYGVNARICKAAPDSAYNFQFIVDAFARKDSTRKPLPHIEVRSLWLRHTNVSYDNLWKAPLNEGLDVNHLAVKDLSVRASLNILTSDTLNVELDRLSFEEKCGFSITEGVFELARGKQSGWTVNDFKIGMPESSIESEKIHYNNGTYSGIIHTQLATNDFKSLYPPLKDIDDIITLHVEAHGTKEKATIQKLLFSDEKQAIHLDINANASHFKDTIPTLDVSLNRIVLSEQFEKMASPILSRRMEGKAYNPKFSPARISALVRKFGNTEINGHVDMSKEGIKANTKVRSLLGEIDAEGSYLKGKVKAHAETQKFKLGEVISLFTDSTAQAGASFGTVTFAADVDGILKGNDGKPEGKVKATIQEAQIKGYTYHGITADVNRKGEQIVAFVESKDPCALLNAEFHVSTNKKQPSIQGLAEVQNLDLASTHLSKTPRVQKVSTKMGIDFKGNTFDNMEGNLSIPHVLITDTGGVYALTNLQLISQPRLNERHIRFNSPYLTVQADGTFAPKTLVAHLKQMAHNWMPDFIPSPGKIDSEADAELTAQVIDLSAFERLIGKPITFEQGPLMVHAKVDSRDKVFKASASVPSVKWGEDNELFHIDAKLDNNPERMHTSLQLEKLIKGDPVLVTFNANTEHDKLNMRFAWDNHKAVKNKGEIQLRGSLERNAAGGLAAYAEVLPTDIYLSDTLWNVHASQMYFRDKELYVDGFRLSMTGGERSLFINGTASQDDEDTLVVDVKDMDLSYIFEAAKVKPLTMGGYATGRIVGRHLFKKAFASGNVKVPYFTFNEAHMGALDAYLSWGDPAGNLSFKGLINDVPNGCHMEVNGTLHLIKDPVQSLDIDVDFTRANCAFIQRYVKNIMSDFQGRASGKVRIYGKFREIDVNGDAFAHECAMTIPMLNTRYHAVNETLRLRPGYVELVDVTGYDRDGKPGQKDHSAIINGRITYEHFRNMHYTFDIDAYNVLAYDTKDFGDMPFYSTAYGTGKVSLQGGPGFVNIDIDATPTAGTSLTYKVHSPETLTNAGFVTYVNRSEKLKEQLEGKPQVEEVMPTNDMRINFNFNITPEAQLRLLMDPRTDDYITLHGNSRLKATYYNKGRFQMYGTYRVDHGTYKMTLQDVIHKEFTFRKGGTIVFGGNPFNADLGLQAVYTVPSVSLNDLSARGTFSNSTVRVNCLMNLGGKAGAPRVTFDFDIPNVNEDELRMVRSLISTEEERNMQVIYLLGIGRFYTYDYTGSQAQSSTAMNSLLSSTLSGQLNQMLSNITGSSNWNIGANLSTGTMGWSDMDVEGMLSGRLLNNRLLINGNFGYRDNPVAASNFIGDFDVQWLLNKQGNFILKAYSETNDRYFTKSALTTQGVGIMAKKDFNTLGDLFSFL
ncbi:MAG: translocation/assembly module TamB, partial [Bacteroidaceae bacterium]|nr:translocation/assembly module TamB [Bacteroidaceae bacterium]